MARLKATTDQRAARVLVLACRRLDRAITSRRAARAEQCRAAVVTHIADLLEEFGLEDEAASVRKQLPEFDGRHLET